MAIFLAGDAAGAICAGQVLRTVRDQQHRSLISRARRGRSTAGHLFFENTHQVPRETPEAQQAIARLDLNYYIPCHAQQKTIAVLGLGKTTQGDFLSSEDMELLETLGGYLGIAIQNCTALCLIAAESGGVRAPQRLQREHRGIHQRGRDGSRYGRPHRELERADGSDVRGAALADPDPAAESYFPGSSLSKNSIACGRMRAFATCTSSA